MNILARGTFPQFTQFERNKLLFRLLFMSYVCVCEFVFLYIFLVNTFFILFNFVGRKKSELSFRRVLS